MHGRTSRAAYPGCDLWAHRAYLGSTLIVAGSWGVRVEVGRRRWTSSPCALGSLLCAQTSDSASRISTTSSAELIAALREPLRVAFAGRVSMGKFALVEARCFRRRSLRRVIVDPAEVVDRFEVARLRASRAHPADDSRRQAFLTPAGCFRPPIRCPTANAEDRVLLPYAPILNRITLVDTPGLESLTKLSPTGRRSPYFPVLPAAIADADALVYMMGTGTTVTRRLSRPSTNLPPSVRA